MDSQNTKQQPDEDMNTSLSYEESESRSCLQGKEGTEASEISGHLVGSVKVKIENQLKFNASRKETNVIDVDLSNIKQEVDGDINDSSPCKQHLIDVQIKQEKAVGRPKKYATKEEQRAAAYARKRERLAKETEEAKVYRLRRDAEAKRRRRHNETADERESRLWQQAAINRYRRYNETEQQRLARLSQQAFYSANRRQNETEEARTARLWQQSLRDRNRRQNETEEARSARLSKQAHSDKNRRQNESEEARSARLLQQALRDKIRRQNESAEARAARLMQQALCDKIRRQNETDEARSARLLKQAVCDRHRRQNESDEARSRRLLQSDLEHFDDESEEAPSLMVTCKMEDEFSNDSEILIGTNKESETVIDVDLGNIKQENENNATSREETEYVDDVRENPQKATVACVMEAEKHDDINDASQLIETSVESENSFGEHHYLDQAES